MVDFSDQKLSVLIVDTVTSNRATMKRAFEKECFSVVAEADNGTTALQQFKLHKPDIAVVEIRLPGISGLLVAKEMISIDPQAIIIMTSEIATKDVVEKAMAVGAKHFQVKPIKFSDLIAAMKRAIAFKVMRILGDTEEKLKQIFEALNSKLTFMGYVEKKEELESYLEKISSEEHRSKISIESFKLKKEQLLESVQDYNTTNVNVSSKFTSINTEIKEVDKLLTEKQEELDLIEQRFKDSEKDGEDRFEAMRSIKFEWAQYSEEEQGYQKEFESLSLAVRELEQECIRHPEDRDLRSKLIHKKSNRLKILRRIHIVHMKIETLKDRENKEDQKFDQTIKIERSVLLDRKLEIEKMLVTLKENAQGLYKKAAILESEHQSREEKMHLIKNEEAKIQANIFGEIRTFLKYSVGKEVILEEINRVQQLLENQFYKEITIMFAEINNSMQYFEKLGVLEGRKIIEIHNNIVFPVIKEYGKLIKSDSEITIGCFDDTFSGLGCSVKAMREIDKYNRGVQDEIRKISLRICLHYGPGIIEETGGKLDVFGDVVNTTSRLGQFKDEQFGKIVVSKEIYLKHQHEKNLKFKFYRSIEAKGKKEPLDLYTIGWQEGTV